MWNDNNIYWAKWLIIVCVCVCVRACVCVCVRAVEGVFEALGSGQEPAYTQEQRELPFQS